MPLAPGRYPAVSRVGRASRLQPGIRRETARSPGAANSRTAPMPSSISAAVRAARAGGAPGAASQARSAAAVPICESFARRSAGSATFKPMPITTCTGPPDSVRISIRMPPSLPCGGDEVIRPFEPHPFDAQPAQRAQAPIPTTARLSAPMAADNPSKLQLHDRQTAPPGGASQLRPRRPRPAVWNSAVRKSNCPVGGAGRASNCALVESSSPAHSPSRSGGAQRRRQQPLARLAPSSGVVGQRQAIAAMGHGVYRRTQVAQAARRLSRRRCA